MTSLPHTITKGPEPAVKGKKKRLFLTNYITLESNFNFMQKGSYDFEQVPGNFALCVKIKQD